MEKLHMNKEFFDTIKQGNLGEVQRLLSVNPCLIHERENGLSPIIVASYHQETEVAEFLTDKAGGLTIFEAASRGKTSQIVRLLAHNPFIVDAYSEDGFQPLGLASFFGQRETAEYLIKAGAPLNCTSRNSNKATPIQSAAAAGHLRIVTLLLDYGADPNLRDHEGNTPLHSAAQNGDTEMIRSLLFNGADLTICNKNGKMPMDLACEAGHTKAAGVLKEGITRRFRTKQPSPIK
jgi:ankyrin repeat protein